MPLPPSSPLISWPERSCFSSLVNSSPCLALYAALLVLKSAPPSDVGVPLGRGTVGSQFLDIHFHCCMLFGFRAFLFEDTTGERLAPVRRTASGHRAADCCFFFKKKS